MEVVSSLAELPRQYLATLGISGRASWRAPYDPYLVPSPHIVPPYCYRCPFGLTYPSCGVACADDLERTILQEGAETVSAFIAEPVVGTSLAGVVPVAEYYGRIREICDRYNVLFIADEVLTGTAAPGVRSRSTTGTSNPTSSRSARASGRVTCRWRRASPTCHVVDALRSGGGRFVHGFTYSGMPISCFVGQQVFDYVQRHGLFEASADERRVPARAAAGDGADPPVRGRRPGPGHVGRRRAGGRRGHQGTVRPRARHHRPGGHGGRGPRGPSARRHTRRQLRTRRRPDPDQPRLRHHPCQIDTARRRPGRVHGRRGRDRLF